MRRGVGEKPEVRSQEPEWENGAVAVRILASGFWPLTPLLNPFHMPTGLADGLGLESALGLL